MANASKKQLGGSNSKKGRNTNKCSTYKARNVRLTNKRRKVAKHLKTNPNDNDAKNSI